MTAILPWCVVTGGYQRILTRFGIITGTLQPGLHWVTPCLDSYFYVWWQFQQRGSRVRGYDIPTHTLRYDPAKLSCVTKDQINIDVDLLIEFRVVDVIIAARSSPNLFASIESLVLAATYESVRNMTLHEITPAPVQKAVQDRLEEHSEAYGFVVQRVFVESIGLPKNIQDATVAVEAQRRQKVAELDKLKAESEIKLSQQKLKLQLTEAAAVEEMLIVANGAKKRKAEAEAQVLVDEMMHQQALRKQRQQAELENEMYKQRLVALRESGLTPQMIVEMQRSETLRALAKDPASKLILAPQDALREQHLHLRADN